MKLVIINGNGNDDYDVSAHRADCADVPKAIKGHDHFTEDHASKRSAWLEYNGDFLAEGSGAWPIHFFPCTDGLPSGGSYNTSTDEEPSHPPRGTWQSDVNGLVEGDGQFTYISNDKQEHFTVVTYFGQADGKPVIQIDGGADLRVNVNDCPVFDRSTDSESRVNIAALAYYRHLTGQEDRHRIDPNELRAELVALGFTPDAGRD